MAWAISSAIVLVVVLAGPVAAFDAFELEAYPATTDGEGLHEIESRSSFVADGPHGDAAQHRLLRTTLEYNYGLSDHVDAAAYLDVDRADGRTAEYSAARFRLRGGLWEQGRFPIDLGWYVEAAMPRRGPTDLELEFRPLASFEVDRLSVDVNPQFEFPTVTSERRTLEFGYSARAYWRTSAMLTPAIEVFGGLGQIREVDATHQQQHYVFPMLYARLLPGVKAEIGPGFGLTRGSDTVLFKLAVEWEFTSWFGHGWP